MGMYIYLADREAESMREVEDIEVNEALQEALQHDKSIMVKQRTWLVKRGWFLKKVLESDFSVYHEMFAVNGKPVSMARLQISASCSRQATIAYLYGIINGSKTAKQTIKL